MKYLKTISAYLLCAVTVIGQQYSNRYDYLITTDGKEYNQVSIKRREGNSILIYHKTGITRIPISSIPDNILIDLDIPTRTDIENARKEKEQQREREYQWRDKRAEELRKLSAAAAEEAERASRGLGRTDRQILSNLEEYFPVVEKSTPIRGRPRRMGQTADNLAHIEIIGEPSDVHSATVMIGIPNDAPTTLIRNVGICLILLNNALPSWDDRADWFNSALEKINASPEKSSEETSVGNATVKLILVKQLGMCTLSVTRNE